MNLKISDMYLNFFVKDGKRYRRFSERHLQRAYSADEIKSILKKAGFSKITLYDGFSYKKPTKKSQRIVFAAE